MALSLSDCLREARNIPCFNGTDDYCVTSYLRDMDTVLSLTDIPHQPVVQSVMVNKLRGKALNSIETLTNPTYEQIVIKLKEEFGIKSSFVNLRNEAMNISANNISDLHSKLSEILTLMNKKFNLEDRIEPLYTPKNNEKLIFDVYLTFLPCHIKSLLIQNNINQLNKAYTFYVENNILTDVALVNGTKNKFTKFSTHENKIIPIHNYLDKKPFNYIPNNNSKTYNGAASLYRNPSQGNSYHQTVDKKTVINPFNRDHQKNNGAHNFRFNNRFKNNNGYPNRNSGNYQHNGNYNRNFENTKYYSNRQFDYHQPRHQESHVVQGEVANNEAAENFHFSPNQPTYP